MSNTWSPFQKPNPNRPSHHTNNSGTGFKNPWPSAEAPSWSELLKSNFPLSFYPNLGKKHPEIRDVQVVVPDWGAADLKKRGLERESCVVGTTLGHAGVVTELPLEGTVGEKGEKESFWIVFDPIFSTRAGPTQYTGPGRMKKSPCQASDLPGCDAVLISHNHYDHLDLSTIQAICKKFPKAKYFVPLGNKSWFSTLGIPSESIVELDWWDKREYSVQDFEYSTPESTSKETILRFTCVPSQHNSGRGALDQGQTLWCGWVIEQLLTSKDEAEFPTTQRKGAIYHAGDTGYRRTAKSDIICPVFKEIGEKYGPFDISFLPIWRGGSLGFLSNIGLRLSHKDIPSALHGSPADAIDMHKDVRSLNSVGIHFGTFVGSENESLEAILEFEEAREEANVLPLNEDTFDERGRAGVVDIGGSVAVRIKAHDVNTRN
ncbi:hypothetical protein IFR05_003929 [Cadophora sp. M221]|nr:hypothetical protein IFR05_003929 [Cadophora sp. M221]